MAIQKRDLGIRRYCKWTGRFKDSPINLTGYGAKMQIRSIKDNAVLADLSTENGKIVISPSEGTITMTLLSAETALITEHKGKYDFLLVDSEGENIPFMEGEVTISQGVTIP